MKAFILGKANRFEFRSTSYFTHRPANAVLNFTSVIRLMFGRQS
jgi:hypothetical protein